MKQEIFTDSVTLQEWAVVVLETGDTYGRGDCFTADEPMVEFYDRRYQENESGQGSHHAVGNERGQFVSRYYASTLLNSYDHENGTTRDNRGLNLHGGVPAWSIEAPTYAVILGYVTEAIAAKSST